MAYHRGWWCYPKKCTSTKCGLPFAQDAPDVCGKMWEPGVCWSSQPPETSIFPVESCESTPEIIVFRIHQTIYGLVVWNGLVWDNDG